MGVAAGNGTEAARLAGYKGSYATLATVANENLNKPEVIAAMEARIADDPAVADREERQQFWTAAMREKQVEMKDRLKASELLGKSQADFVDRHEHSGPNGAPMEIVAHDLGPLSVTELKQLREIVAKTVKP